MSSLRKHIEDPLAAELAPRKNESASSFAQSGTQRREAMVQTSHGTIALVETKANGLPFIFLHGNSACKEIFAAQIEGPIGQQHRLIALDLPGHGKSDNAVDPAAAYTIPGYADAVGQIIEALGLDQTVIVGWSLGGHVAIELMATFPNIVGAFTIGTPPLGKDEGYMSRAFRPHDAAPLLIASDHSESDSRALAAAVLGPDLADFATPIIRRTDGRARSRLFDSLLCGDFEDERCIVETSAIPLAVVLGQNDPFIIEDYVQKLSYANLWRGHCHILPSGGHAPFLVIPQVFNNLFAKFASEMEARAKSLQEQPILVYGG